MGKGDIYFSVGKLYKRRKRKTKTREEQIMFEEGVKYEIYKWKLRSCTAYSLHENLKSDFQQNNSNEVT